MIKTIGYVVFVSLLSLLISQALPVVTELPFGIDSILSTAAANAFSAIYYYPFLQPLWNIFQLTLQIAFYIFFFWGVTFFISMGGSGPKHK